MDTSTVDEIIKGRVLPHIYAFRTGTIPDYLKVGDTYRPVEVRLREWSAYYEKLEEVYREKATVSDDVFFRDYAVHQYLDDVLNIPRLKPEDNPPGVHYSNEFFRGATGENVKEAVKDIRSDFKASRNRYQYYRFDESRIPILPHYPRNEEPFKPRKEQDDTVKRFVKAYKEGRKNLLMYAVMRFGKSFTAMLCAKAIDAQLVVVLCGKTCVKDEWQRNVEIPQNFDGYSFITRTELDANNHLLSQAKANGQRIVLFLTLQDLSGDEIKTRHKELFESIIDLLIIDETHFGARAPEYGKVLQEEFGKEAINKGETNDEDDIEALEEAVKLLKAKIKLHLSGTPYRILMGSEFEPEDVIAFYQFTDIVYAQQKWDHDNLGNRDKKEWDNPYYGFPQMVRFAFNPSESARRLIKELREKGKTCALSALFEPSSIKKSKDGKHRQFKHQKEVLELLQAIDGFKPDDEIFSFLNYTKIKEGEMCKHMVFVLPFRASCDAMQALLIKYKRKFKNLRDYEILNIAGHDTPKSLKDIGKIKDIIQKCDDDGNKSITLTVNKMLTGSTVECWDTMVYLKDTSSPQDYDQAIFRIQNPYIKTLKDPSGDEIKFNMKPQTLLVDFDIDRLFQLQALKSQIFNYNIDVNGNSKLEERMRQELEISPVIIINKNGLKEVETTDIMEAISEYSKNRSVADEARDVPVDMRLMDDPVIKAEIDKQGAISSKEGLSIKPVEGEGDDIEIDGVEAETDDTADEEIENDGKKTKKEKETPEELFRKRFATYYSRILFFTFLSASKITNLDELIDCIDVNEDNARIAKNLGLKKKILSHLRNVMDGNKLGALEFKIQNLNHLERDSELTPLERAKTAMRRFSRLSIAEITTPEETTRNIVSLLPKDCTPDSHYLDIAAKQGEFSIALIERLGEKAKNNIWSLPTSGVAYEFTRKIYEFLEMPLEHILSEFTSFDLLGDNKQSYIDTLKVMKFDVIVGNPPYQSIKATDKAGINKAFSSAIYPAFVEVARMLSPHYISLVIPSRWMTGTGQGISDEWVRNLINSNHFIEIHDFYDSTDCFKDVELKGGVNYFLYSDSYTGECHYTLHQANKVYSRIESLNSLGAGIVIRDPKASDIVKKIVNVEGNYFNEGNSFDTLVGPQHFYDKDGKLTTRWTNYKKEKDQSYNIKYYLNRQVEAQGYAWIKESDIPKNTATIKYHKVYLSKAFNGGDALPHQIIGHAFYGEPESVCSQTYLVIGWNQKDRKLTAKECRNIISYMNTRFFRYLVFIKKKTQDNPSSVFQFVPMQDFSQSWNDKKLFEKYKLEPDEIDFIKATIKIME